MFCLFVRSFVRSCAILLNCCYILRVLAYFNYISDVFVLLLIMSLS